MQRGVLLHALRGKSTLPLLTVPLTTRPVFSGLGQSPQVRLRAQDSSQIQAWEPPSKKTLPIPWPQNSRPYLRSKGKWPASAHGSTVFTN